MSIFIPIEGAGTEPPFVHVLAVMSSLDIKGHDLEARHLTGVDVYAETTRTARAAFTVGKGQTTPVVAALDAGTGHPAAILSATDTQGERIRNFPSALELRGELPASAVRSSVEARREAPARFLSSLQSTGNVVYSIIAGADVRRTALLNVRSSLELTLPRAGQIMAGLEIGAGTSAPIFAGMDVFTAEGLDVLIDIVSAVVASGRAGSIIKLTARMRVNGAVTPFESFACQAPPDTLGARLDVVMTREIIAQVPADASIDFEIGFIGAGGVTQYVMLIKGGRLAGRALNLSADDEGSPQDRLSVSIVNVLADRWQLAPRAATFPPSIFYDPSKVPEKDVKPDTKNAVRDKTTGAAIVPHLRPVAGLNMRRILDFAYVDGCGFKKVITNIPNFPVKVVSFDLTGTFHGTAAALISIFDPVYFADDADILFIIDTERPLPAGFTPRALPLGAVIDPSWTLPAKNFINALILTYPVDPNEVNEDLRTIEVLEQDPLIESPVGEFGQDGYTETQASRRIRKTYDVHDPANFLSEATIEETTEIHGMVDGAFDLIQRDKQRDEYDTRGLKTGHLRTIEASVLTPEHGGRTFQTVETETNVTAWMTDPQDPSESLMLWSETRTEGKVLVEPEAAPDGTDIRTPIMLAQQNRIIDVDSSSQHTEDVPIKTVRSSLRPKGGAVNFGGAQQWEIYTVETDHLTGTAIPRRPQLATGSNSVGNQAGQNRQILLRDEASEALYGMRQPASMSAGIVPESIAIPQAENYLQKLAHGRLDWSTDLPGVDAAARRGSVFVPNDRDGITGTFIVTGWNVAGKPVSDGAFDIWMSLQGRELKQNGG